jgi:hypothetical protein
MVEKIKTLGLHHIYRKEKGVSKDKKRKRKEKGKECQRLGLFL